MAPTFEAYETPRDPDSGLRLVEFVKIAEKLVKAEEFCLQVLDLMSDMAKPERAPDKRGAGYRNCAAR